MRAAHLVGGQPHTGGRVHRFHHVVDELLKLPVQVRDLSGALPQNRVPYVTIRRSAIPSSGERQTGDAFRSSRPARRAGGGPLPAAAIMAALSVQRPGGGMKRSNPSASASTSGRDAEPRCRPHRPPPPDVDAISARPASTARPACPPPPAENWRRCPGSPVDRTPAGRAPGP